MSRTRLTTLGAMLVAAAAMLLAVCTGCRGIAGTTPAPVSNPTANPTANPAVSAAPGSGAAGQLGARLDQLQSTLDSVQAQINADAGP